MKRTRVPPTEYREQDNYGHPDGLPPWPVVLFLLAFPAALGWAFGYSGMLG